MPVINYEETLSDKEHAVAWLESFDDWRKLGAHEKAPEFKTYQVRAGNLSACLAFNKENEILAVDNLENKKVEEGPRTRIFELLEEFCKRRELGAKLFIVTNIVEEKTWELLCNIGSDGNIREANPSYDAIMGTKIGKIAKGLGDVKSIWATEFSKADGGQKFEGPSLIFIYADIA